MMQMQKQWKRKCFRREKGRTWNTSNGRWKYKRARCVGRKKYRFDSWWEFSCKGISHQHVSRRWTEFFSKASRWSCCGFNFWRWGCTCLSAAIHGTAGWFDALCWFRRASDTTVVWTHAASNSSTASCHQSSWNRNRGGSPEAKKARVETQKTQRINHLRGFNESHIRTVKIGDDAFATLETNRVLATGFLEKCAELSQVVQGHWPHAWSMIGVSKSTSLAKKCRCAEADLWPESLLPQKLV